LGRPLARRRAEYSVEKENFENFRCGEGLDRVVRSWDKTMRLDIVL